MSCTSSAKMHSLQMLAHGHARPERIFNIDRCDLPAFAFTDWRTIVALVRVFNIGELDRRICLPLSKRIHESIIYTVENLC